MTHSTTHFTEEIKQVFLLRIEANQAGIYAIEEAPNKWLCIRKSDGCYLSRGERSESLAIITGLSRAKVSQQQIDM